MMPAVRPSMASVGRLGKGERGFLPPKPTAYAMRAPTSACAGVRDPFLPAPGGRTMNKPSLVLSATVTVYGIPERQRGDTVTTRPCARAVSEPAAACVEPV